ncbi:MAG: hypothetical protein HXN88_08370 [Prevotella pallens]|jgi:hypothetical protein|nr:hypothetical protein [Prevotella pallens]
MPSRFNYNKEQKEMIIKELKAGENIKSLAKKFCIPCVIIENWRRQNELDGILDISYIQSNTQKKNNLYVTIRSMISSAYRSSFKNKKSTVVLVTGLLFTLVIVILFYDTAEFKPQSKTDQLLGPKIDSLIQKGIYIEGKINEQNQFLIQQHASFVSNCKAHIPTTSKGDQPKGIRNRRKYVKSTDKNDRYCTCHKDTI